MTTAKKTHGLENVIAGQSAICTVGTSNGFGLRYRGYAIEDLAEQASFEEVAYLMLFEKLPNQKELNHFKKTLIEKRDLPETLKTILENIPKSAHPMDVLRSGCSVLGSLEPENESHHALSIAIRLIANFPAILLYWHHFHQYNKKISTDLEDDSTAAYFLHMLNEKTPDTLQTEMLNVSLILYAEHGFNASTFSARVTTATGSDFYSAICSAIGTLRGALHGGANEGAYELIAQFKNVENAEIGVRKMLEKKKRIMGFGHRVYTICDPRATIIKNWAKKLAHQAHDNSFYDIAERIEEIMWKEKKLFPNIDYFSAPAYAFCHIPKMMFTPLFAMSRITGWTAHIIEQRRNNRLIRPSCEYTGPSPRNFISINAR